MKTHKYSVIVGTQHRQIYTKHGQMLLESLIDSAIILKSSCNGKGICGKCKVRVVASNTEPVAPPNKSELDLLSYEELQVGFRFACTLKTSEGLMIEIPETSLASEETLQKGSALLFENFPDIGTGPFEHKKNIFGLAVDLGTTTIGIYLCNLFAGKIAASISVKNPQSIFGDDVISRIMAIRSDHKLLFRLQTMAVKGIEWGVSCLCQSTKIEPGDIKKMVVVGNSTMIHIFVGESPSSIGISPYNPSFLEEKFVSAKSIGLRFNSETKIVTLPLISGFLGADIISAALAVNLQHAKLGTMLVDLGTNGEIMIKGKRRFLAASCATGPAFEGAAIYHGMQAVSGAIDNVSFDKELRETICSIIQKDKKRPKLPSGICGSGVISAVATLYRSSIILGDGAFNQSNNQQNLRLNTKKVFEYVLVAPEKAHNGRAITLTQGDIRAVQLAKAALRTGIDLLCRKAEIEYPEKIMLAGAFGNYIRKKDALEIGMFPQLMESDIKIVGNAAGVGAIKALFDESFLNKANEMIKKTQVLELTENSEFQKTFLENIAFPNG